LAGANRKGRPASKTQGSTNKNWTAHIGHAGRFRISKPPDGTRFWSAIAIPAEARSARALVRRTGIRTRPLSVLKRSPPDQQIGRRRQHFVRAVWRTILNGHSTTMVSAPC
jgi:hypothetical protein